MRPGVLYRHFSAGGELLYIGSSVNVLSRNMQHSRSSSWFKNVASITLEHFDSIADARKAEIYAIQKEFPRENFRHVENHLLRRKIRNHGEVSMAPHIQLDAICNEFMITRSELQWKFKRSHEQLNEIASTGRNLTDDEIVYLTHRLPATFVRLKKIGVKRRKS